MESIIQVMRDPDYDQFPEELGAAGREAFLYEAFKELALRLHSYGHRVGSPHFESWLHELCDSLARFCRSHALIYRKIESVSIAAAMGPQLGNDGGGVLALADHRDDALSISHVPVRGAAHPCSALKRRLVQPSFHHRQVAALTELMVETIAETLQCRGTAPRRGRA